jgi:hypothetical protein
MRVAEGGRAQQVFRAREEERKKDNTRQVTLGREGGKKERKRKRSRAALFKECRPSHFREKEKE